MSKFTFLLAPAGRLVSVVYFGAVLLSAAPVKSASEQWEKFVKDGGRVEQADVSDLVIQLGPSNDSAVASYRLTVTIRAPDGKATTEVNQETDVLLKRLGAWKIVHLHYSPAKK